MEDDLNKVRDILIKNAQNPSQAKMEIDKLEESEGGVLMVSLLGGFEEKNLFFEILDELQELKTTKKIKSLEIDKKEAPQPITTDKEEEIDLDEIDLDNLVL